MTMGILAILQSSLHSSLCNISNGVEKSSRDYYSFILKKSVTEILTEAASWYISYSEVITKTARKSLKNVSCAEIIL